MEANISDLILKKDLDISKSIKNAKIIPELLNNLNVRHPTNLGQALREAFLASDQRMERDRMERDSQPPEKENYLRVPDKPEPKPEFSESLIPPTPAQPLQDRERIMQSLDSVFIDDVLKDNIITRTAIPDLLEGREPAYTGVILFGPPGTGKTVLLKAISDVYLASGAYAKGVSVSEMNSHWVGDFAKNLEREITTALSEAKNRGKPSFLYFDEASSLAQKAEVGSEGVSKHYQEAIDVMKKYIGNERNLVVAISTNLSSESFEDALTREGRLTRFFIGYPDVEQRKRMWKHFTGEYKVITLTDEQAYQLAKAIPAEQGAFIEEFARNYRQARKTAILKEKGYDTLLSALKHSANITDDKVTESITFDSLSADLGATLKAKYDRLKKDKHDGNGHNHIGF